MSVLNITCVIQTAGVLILWVLRFERETSFGSFFFFLSANLLLSWYGPCYIEGSNFSEALPVSWEMARSCRERKCGNSYHKTFHKGDQCSQLAGSHWCAVEAWFERECEGIEEVNAGVVVSCFILMRWWYESHNAKEEYSDFQIRQCRSIQWKKKITVWHQWAASWCRWAAEGSQSCDKSWEGSQQKEIWLETYCNASVTHRYRQTNAIWMLGMEKK